MGIFKTHVFYNKNNDPFAKVYVCVCACVCYHVCPLVSVFFWQTDSFLTVKTRLQEFKALVKLNCT